MPRHARAHYFIRRCGAARAHLAIRLQERSARVVDRLAAAVLVHHSGGTVPHVHDARVRRGQRVREVTPRPHLRGGNEGSWKNHEEAHEGSWMNHEDAHEGSWMNHEDAHEGSWMNHEDTHEGSWMNHEDTHEGHG